MGELLVKAVQENPMVQQMTKSSPDLAKIIGNVGTLQKMFSPEMIRQVQSGHANEASLEKMLGLASDPGTSSAMPEGLKIKQVKAGDGKTFPADGDEAVLEYSGYLKDGTM